MTQEVRINTNAPDFELQDYTGHRVRLSDFYGAKSVILVFNRGFI
jgi:peroxiredoxin